MAVSASEMAARYAQDKEKAKGHLEFLQRGFTYLSQTLPGEKGYTSYEMQKIAAVNNAISKLTGEEELSQEAVENEFKNIQDNADVLNCILGNNSSVRDVMLDHPDLGDYLQDHMREFDAFYGTDLMTQKPYKGQWLTSDYNEKVSAAQFIRNFRSENITKKPRTDEQLEDQILTIMAARALSGCKRNDLETLESAQITRDEVEIQKNVLRNSKAYQEFMEDVKVNPDTRKAAIKALTSGHGGKLDELFTKHLANNYRPCEMPNGPELQRYMPTVKQRIEGLQNNPTNDPSAAAAEILVLRNRIHAERNNKATLNKPVPTNFSLSTEATALANDTDFMDIMTDPAVLRQYGAGHGGQMIIEMRKASKACGAGETVQGILEENTYKQAAKAARQTAETLYNALSGKEKLDARFTEKDILDCTKNTITKYYALNNAAGAKPTDTKKAADAKLESDVNWGKVNKHRNAENTPLSQMTPQNAKTALRSMYTRPFNSFFENGLKEEKNARASIDPNAPENRARNTDFQTLKEDEISF